MWSQLRIAGSVLLKPKQAFAALSSKRPHLMSFALLFYFALVKALRKGMLAELHDFAGSWTLAVSLLAVLVLAGALLGAGIAKGILRCFGRRGSLWGIINVMAFAQVPRFVLSVLLSIAVWLMPQHTREVLFGDPSSGVWPILAAVSVGVLLYSIGLMIWALSQCPSFTAGPTEESDGAELAGEEESCPDDSDAVASSRLGRIAYWVAVVLSPVLSVSVWGLTIRVLPWLGDAYLDARMGYGRLPKLLLFTGNHSVALCMILGVAIPAAVVAVNRCDRNLARKLRMHGGAAILLIVFSVSLLESLLLPYLEIRQITALASHASPEVAAILHSQACELLDMADASLHGDSVDLRVGEFTATIAATVERRVDSSDYGSGRECGLRFDVAVKGMSHADLTSRCHGAGGSDSDAYRQAVSEWLDATGVPLLRALRGAEPSLAVDDFRFYLGTGRRSLADHPDAAMRLLRALVPHLGGMPEGLSILSLFGTEPVFPEDGAKGRGFCSSSGKRIDEMMPLIVQTVHDLSISGFFQPALVLRTGSAPSVSDRPPAGSSQ